MTQALVAYLIAGATLGGAWLGLLWMSARAIAAPRPVARFAVLAIGRALLVGGALAMALGGGATAPQLLAALAGFTLMRIAATRIMARAPGEAGPWK